MHLFDLGRESPGQQCRWRDTQQPAWTQDHGVRAGPRADLIRPKARHPRPWRTQSRPLAQARPALMRADAMPSSRDPTDAGACPPQHQPVASYTPLCCVPLRAGHWMFGMHYA